MGRKKKIVPVAIQPIANKEVISNAPIGTSDNIRSVADEIDIASKFTDKNDRKQAKSLLSRYLHDFIIESVSDINTLKEIIYLEIVQFHLHDKLSDMYSSDTKIMNFSTLDIIHKNSDAILKLKATLGLKKEQERLDDYSSLELLKKRFKRWGEENQGSRYLKCPHCIKPILLKIRTEAWEALKHPFFQDNFLCNKHLLAHLGKTVEIDANFIAKVFNTSPNYITWMLARMVNPTSEINLVSSITTPSATTEVQDGKVQPDGTEEEKGQKEVIKEDVNDEASESSSSTSSNSTQ